MVALLRYRRIAYRLLLSTTGAPGAAGSQAAAAATFYLPGPDGALQAVTESTPLIRRFEAEFAGRALVPADPALALVDALLEDFGDEWLTKAMFHTAGLSGRHPQGRRGAGLLARRPARRCGGRRGAPRQIRGCATWARTTGRHRGRLPRCWRWKTTSARTVS